MHRWKEQVALVTGASSGIGRAAATAFAREGARVIVADVLDDAGEQTVHVIRSAGGDAIFARADVSKPDDLAALFARISATYGRLDFAFNNAGIEGVIAPTQECSEENWDRTFAVNLKGVWLCMKHELTLMLPRAEGVIVNCASIAGLVGFAGLPAYVASKHGLVGLTRCAALEYAERGVRINALCPGVVRTPMVERLIQAYPESEARFVAGTPMGRLGRPEEIGEAVVWLCAREASFVTGQAFAVDGGWIAQ